MTESDRPHPRAHASTRLPGKPLADIHGEPMIVHVWRRAVEADVGPVLVAADDRRIVEAIEAVGGRAVLTRPDHASGSDRIFEAVGAFDPEARHDVVVNVQGDLPTIERRGRARRGRPARRSRSRHRDAGDRDQARRRARRSQRRQGGGRARSAPGRLRALYFTRARAPWGEGPLLHHIGLYAYRRAALARFVALPPSPLERRERLEQLRALEAGMRIDIALVDVAPLGVDTPDDLRRARERLAPRGKS